jgi:hypothetical protein
MNLFFYIFARPYQGILSRGVMVALQILVLPAQVRVLAGQQINEGILLLININNTLQLFHFLRSFSKVKPGMGRLIIPDILPGDT